MLHVLFTLDYEIHGNGEGDPSALMVEPTNRLMDLLEPYGAKLTIMADVAEILKFKQYRDRVGRDDFHYEAIADQLRQAIRRGHDVQLHLHSSYFNATFNGSQWEQDWAEYNFAGLPLPRMEQVVAQGREFLEKLLKPVEQRYNCIAFRAANWSVNPSPNVIRALVNNGILIDTSVFKYGKRKGLVSFDYSSAYSEIRPWKIGETDICQSDDDGNLTELPIYSEHRWIGAFLSRNRIHRVLVSKRHPILNPYQNASKRDWKEQLLGKVKQLISRHAWKADFNQCTGHQLKRALKRAAKKHDSTGTARLPFNTIGHSKLFDDANARSLVPFLAFVRDNPSRFAFETLSFWQDVTPRTPANLVASGI